jgi:uncharacterized protein YecT (DUF1311 family)
MRTHILMLVFIAAALPASAREYCAGLEREQQLECWNSETDEKQAVLERELAYSRRQATQAGKTYGLDVDAAVGLMDKSQAAWTAYAEEECALQREAVGSGADRNAQEMNCYLGKLDERIDEVRKQWPR